MIFAKRPERIANPSYCMLFIEAVEQKSRENNVTDRSIRGSNLEFNSKSGAVGVPKRIQPANPKFRLSKDVLFTIQESQLDDEHVVGVHWCDIFVYGRGESSYLWLYCGGCGSP